MEYRLKTSPYYALTITDNQSTTCEINLMDSISSLGMFLKKEEVEDDFMINQQLLKETEKQLEKALEEADVPFVVLTSSDDYTTLKSEINIREDDKEKGILSEDPTIFVVMTIHRINHSKFAELLMRGLQLNIKFILLFDISFKVSNRDWLSKSNLKYLNDPTYINFFLNQNKLDSYGSKLSNEKIKKQQSMRIRKN